MTTYNQIFVSFCEADKDAVTDIVHSLEKYSFKFHFDPDKRYVGEDFKERLRYQISQSNLFIIFFSRNRNPKGILNYELEYIEEASRKLRTSPRIIPVLLDGCPVDPAHVDMWVINQELTYLKYTAGRKKEAEQEILKSLGIWVNQFKRLPQHLSDLAERKLQQDPDSKQTLSHWVLKNFPPKLPEHRSFFIGCGTTLSNIWDHSLRSLVMNGKYTGELHTNNGFILHTEQCIQKDGHSPVLLKLTGDIHLTEYSAHHYSEPEKHFPSVDFSLISVSGIKLDQSTFNLRLCWEELSDTIKQVFYKTNKEIMIVAAGRKIVESEGSGNIELLSLLNRTSAEKHRKLTFVIDTDVNPAKQEAFNDKVTLLSKMFGEPQTSTDHPVLYWQTMI